MIIKCPICNLKANPENHTCIEDIKYSFKSSGSVVFKKDNLFFYFERDLVFVREEYFYEGDLIIQNGNEIKMDNSRFFMDDFKLYVKYTKQNVIEIISFLYKLKDNLEFL